MTETPYRTNALDQPVGLPVTDWFPPPRPQRTQLDGRYCRLEPLDSSRHGADLHAANSLDLEGRMWTYLFAEPFKTLAEFTIWLEAREDSLDPLYFAIIDSGLGRATGLASYLRIDTTHGSIEVGHLAYSPLLQRTRAATEAMYLMMKHAFELGYRRYEWKCDSLNTTSLRAAERLGFRFEGIFRQAAIYKGRNRDTAWFSVIDSEWPEREREFLAWLDPSNFDGDGRQIRPLRGP
jgi:RimJ/RimL family protein N-acetyltransferase